MYLPRLSQHPPIARTVSKSTDSEHSYESLPFSLNETGYASIGPPDVGFRDDGSASPPYIPEGGVLLYT